MLPEQIADKIRIMMKKKLADVLIIGRGGGSLEDLWPFNEEIVARAIYDSEIPIISAVGHETDFTIADFVADLRAPTPSAAAELAVPDIFEVKQKIINYQDRSKLALKKKIEIMKLRFEKIMKIQNIYNDPMRKVMDNSIILDDYMKRLENAMKEIKTEKKNKYTELVTKLDSISPLKTLIRGYSLTEKDGKIIKRATQIDKGDIITIKFSDGEKNAEIL